jgi:hypothetical protein
MRTMTMSEALFHDLAEAADKFRAAFAYLVEVFGDEADRQAASVPDPDPVPDPEPTPTPDPDPTPEPDPTPDPTPDPEPPFQSRTTPLAVAAGTTATGWLVHDLTTTDTAVTLGANAVFEDSVVDGCAQAIFGAGTATIRRVTVRNFSGLSYQAHGIYLRHGLVEDVTIEQSKPNSGNGSCSFHGHKESGPVENLTWRRCTDLTGFDAVAAGYVALRDFTIDGFVKPAGKLRVGVSGVTNGAIDLDGLDVNVLQLDGGFSGGRVAGHCRHLVSAGGPGMSIGQARAQWPTLNFDGLTVG